MKRKLIVLIIIAMLAVFLYLECRPCEIFYSSVFTTSEETEICLYVIVNSFLPIDREELASQLIGQHHSINGSRENEVIEKNLAKIKDETLRPYYKDLLVQMMRISKEYQNAIMHKGDR